MHKFRLKLTILLLLSFLGGIMLNADNKERRKKRKKNDAPLTKIPSSDLNADQTYQPHKGFEGAVLDAKSGYVLPYRYKIMSPEKSTEKKYPLFVVFHGVGRVGSNNSRQVSMGLPLVKELERLKVNAIVLQPQTAAGWAQKMVDGSKPVLNSVVELIDHFIASKSADPDRVYVLGNSMGCGGVWNMVFDYPDYLAAAVPVVGGALHERAAEMSKLPLWMISAEKDSKIRVETCRQMFNSLTDLGHTTIKHTHYKDLSHANTFSSMFKRDNVAKWLLQQKRSRE